MTKRKSKKRARALITGIAGFAGSYLAELLLKKGFKVYGLLAPREKTGNIRHLQNNLELERFDILKVDKVSKFIRKAKPDFLFHLAAFSSVGQSFANEKLTYDINFTGTFNVLNAAVGLKNYSKKIVFISSPDIYGLFRPQGKKLDESQPFNPVSPYGVSKVAAEYLCQYYYLNYKLPIICIRPFNHIGPRQSDSFAIPSFCKQVASIEKGLKKPRMSVGDLSKKRDLSDVRDIVRGYYLLARKADPGEVFHLCCGRAVSIRTVLNKLRRMASVDINVNEDFNRFRKLDIPILKGDFSRAAKAVGWFPEYKLEQTLNDTLHYWRNKITK